MSYENDIKTYSHTINNKINKLSSMIHLLQINESDKYINYKKLKQLVGGSNNSDPNTNPNTNPNYNPNDYIDFNNNSLIPNTSNDIDMFNSELLTFRDLSKIDSVGYVELYNKLFNLYILYRFRFSNSFNLNTSFAKLSNNINEIKKNSAETYNNSYIKKIGDHEYVDGIPQDNSILNTNPEKIFFTLRQVSTHIIKNMLLTDEKNKLKIDNLVKFIKSEPVKNILITKNQIDYNEILNKCDLISALVTDNNDDTTFNYTNVTDLMYIRIATNEIIKKIGDQYQDLKKTDILPPGINSRILELFVVCIERLSLTTFKD